MPRDLGGGQWHPGGASHLSGRPLVLFGIHCPWRGGALSMRGASCPWGECPVLGGRPVHERGVLSLGGCPVPGGCRGKCAELGCNALGAPPAQSFGFIGAEGFAGGPGLDSAQEGAGPGDPHRHLLWRCGHPPGNGVAGDGLSCV